MVAFVHSLLGFITHLGLSHHLAWLTFRAGPDRKLIFTNIFVNEVDKGGVHVPLGYDREDDGRPKAHFQNYKFGQFS